ncbi:MAG: hypothetical protein ACXV5C_11645, partial [Halobacteriota archaeon]
RTTRDGGEKAGAEGTRKATTASSPREFFYVEDAKRIKNLVPTSTTNVTSFKEGLLYIIRIRLVIARHKRGSEKSNRQQLEQGTYQLSLYRPKRRPRATDANQAIILS